MTRFIHKDKSEECRNMLSGITELHDLPPGPLRRCQISGSQDLFEAIDLGHQPACSGILTSMTMREPETQYPLRLLVCPSSGLAQLDYVVSSATLYPQNYSYRPGISVPLRMHLAGIADQIVSRLSIQPGALCIDIGSNDGTLLAALRNHGVSVLGVEPTNMAVVAASENDIPTIQARFTEEVAREIRREHGTPQVITFTNSFAHIADLGEVMRGITALLDQTGVVVTESQYLLDVLERNQFDQIYHDHVRIYSLKSLVLLFSLYGMEVFEAERIATREGSIRVYAGRKGIRAISRGVQQLLATEIESGLFEPRRWAQFRAITESNRDQFRDLVFSARKEAASFVADSCPSRGVVLMNYYGLDTSLIPYIAQLPRTDKVGKYLPGTHTPIVSNEVLLKERPAYVLILAWHYAEFIVKQWRARGLDSTFVVPLPRLTLVKGSRIPVP